MAIVEIVASVKIFRMKPSLSYILKLVLFALLIIGCTLCYPKIAWWTAIPIMALVAVGLALLLRLVDMKEILKTIKNKS